MNARETALVLLNEIEEKDSYANLSLKKGLNKADANEKALATELVYGVIRYKMTLDFIRRKFSKIREEKISLSVKNILRLGIYQIFYTEKIPVSAACNESVKLAHKYSNKGAASFVNGVLRNISRNKDNFSFPEGIKEKLMYKYSFPEDITNIVIRDYGESAEQIFSNLNSQKCACIRPNLLKITSEEFEKSILKDRCVKDGTCYYVKSVSDYMEYIEKGLVFIQDRASMMCVETLLPAAGENVLDLCAAPGGKSIYMAQLMGNDGKIVSCDLHSHRVELIKKNARRAGVTTITASLNDGTKVNPDFINKFDKILVDAPCSGFGVISGKPDIKWTKRNLTELTCVQQKILENALMYLNENGVLVYSTCTINKDENERLVKRIKGIKVIEEKQLLPDDKHDGFYIAKVVKTH